MKKLMWVMLPLFLVGCVGLPMRVYEKERMKLDTDETEYVPLWAIDEYVADVMTKSKGYSQGRPNVIKKSVNRYIAISSALFLFGFACFAVAALTQIPKANTVGFISLLGSGCALGVAELARFWWIPVATGILGAVIWLFCHYHKDFSLIQWFKQLRDRVSDSK